MRRRVSVLICSCLAILPSRFEVAEAAPSIALPINAQVPPVARVDQPLSFQFSTSTFASTAPVIVYTLDGAPSWLELDSQTRTLTGSPSREDIGTTVMRLIATDNVGSTAMPVTLLVSEEQGPDLNPLAARPNTTGTFADNNTLLYYPSLPVLVSFPADTFVNTSSTTEYYATCANNTPLPSWLSFNPSALSFSGSAPAFISPYELPQMYAIRLLATNVPGFYTAERTFTIVIERHQFYFEDIEYSILASPGQQVSYEGLQGKLMLDNEPISAPNLKSVAAVTPAWLSFNNNTLKFSGIAPLNLRAGAVAVFAEDVFGGTANTTVSVSSSPLPSLITKDIGPLQATIGQEFNYSLGKDSFAQDNVSTEVDLGDASSWLNYDNKTLVLSGKVPMNLKPGTLGLTLTAMYGGKSQDQKIDLNLISGASNLKSSIASNPATPTTSPQPGSSPTHYPLWLAAAIIIPIIVVLALLLVAFCIRKRRNKPRKQLPSKWDRWHWIPCVALRTGVWRLRSKKRTKTPPGVRYSYMERGPTPQMGPGPPKAPQIEASGLLLKKPANPSPTQGSFRPLANIGQTSRPGSFVRQLASNRWSFPHRAHDPNDRCSRCESASAEEPPVAGQTEVPGLSQASSTETGSLQPPAMTRTAPQGHYSGILGPRPMRSLRQSYILGKPQDDRPGRRSIHGFGHGRPFPEQDIPSTLREESMLSGAWTDTTGSSHTHMNSNSSGGSSIGFPPRPRFSKSLAPQMVRQVRPTIRQVGSPPPASEHAVRESTTSAPRSIPRPPSFQSYIEARNDVVRKLREKDSTSFSGYRTSRKSSGKESPAILEENVPAVPLRLRPALEPQEIVRVSRFYGSQSHSSTAQRKGSLIHDRFRDPRTESPFMYDSVLLSPPRSQWTLPEERDPGPLYTRRRSKSGSHHDLHRETMLSTTSFGGDEGWSDIGSTMGEIAVQAPLKHGGKRHSWTAGEEDMHPVERDMEGKVDDRQMRQMREISAEQQPLPKRIILPKRRGPMADPREAYDTNDGSPVSPLSEEDNAVEGIPRDASFRFL